ncbi:SAM-dependent methyltransferase [Mycobacterium sp. MAA66]|uniref:class I SAM-dependent methyltransferase n=1 Tax=Mycobacterium sp. MAA66 TaxID=3156297 RepID=UPI003519C860
MSQVIDWDGAYRNEDMPAWNIGEPQPEFAALIDRDGAIQGEVLDAGCGYAELALALAARGRTVHGIDLTPTAVAAATAAAAERGLRTATFEQADISSFAGHDGRFGTIFDSGLLHALPVELRDGYLRSVHRAAAPGATFYILAFGAGAFPDHDGPGPTQFTEDELRQVVSMHWQVRSVRPAQLQAGTGAARVGLPGHLLVARKA